MGYGLRYEYGIFRQDDRERLAGRAARTTGCAGRTRGRSPGPARRVEVQLGCSFEVRGGDLQRGPGQPSSSVGVPYDRPVVGYGGKTINTLRLWAAAAPDYFDFEEFSSGDFVGAVADSVAGRDR